MHDMLYQHIHYHYCTLKLELFLPLKYLLGLISVHAKLSLLRNRQPHHSVNNSSVICELNHLSIDIVLFCSHLS